MRLNHRRVEMAEGSLVRHSGRPGYRALFQSGALAERAPLDGDQIQPASLDLRLGEKAYRVRASFMPGPTATVADKLDKLTCTSSTWRKGAVLETGCVYIVPLLESLPCRPTSRPRPIPRVRPAGSTSSPASWRPGAGVRQDRRPAIAAALPRDQPAHLSDLCAPARACRRSAFARAMPCSTRRNSAPCMPGPDAGRLRCAQHQRRRHRALHRPRRRADGLIGYRGKHHTSADRRRQTRRHDGGGFLGAALRAAARSDPRSGRVLHTGLARGGACAARPRSRDDAVRSAGRRVPRALCRLLRSRVRPFRRPAAPAAARCSKCAATRCPSSSNTARSSGAWSTRTCCSRPQALYGSDLKSNYQAQGLKLSKQALSGPPRAAP
jgi:dCTP deaminase